MKIEGVCYLPLVRGLYKRLQGHVPDELLLKDSETVDAQKVLGMFEYGHCDVHNSNDEECVCGHAIKQLYFVYCTHIDDFVMVGSCCIDRWLNKKLIDAAHRDAKLQLKLAKIRSNPDRFCAWCGKQATTLEGRLVHKTCRWAALPDLLDVAKQTPFIESMKQPRTFISNRQWDALTDGRWWSDDRRIALWKRSPNYRSLRF